METSCKYTRLELVWFPSSNPNLQETYEFKEMEHIDDSHYSYYARTSIEMSSKYKYFIVGSLYSNSSTSKLSQTFTTGCISGRLSKCYPQRIAAIGDNQWGSVKFIQIMKRIKNYSPDYLFHLGDAVQSVNNLDNWQTDFFDVLSESGVGEHCPIVYVPGNHDDEELFSHRNKYLVTPSEKWRALSIGNIRVILLNSNVEDGEQLNFLQFELKSDEFHNSSFRIVLIHIPPFIEWWDPKTWEAGEKKWGGFIRQDFVPLFEKYGVDLVISGHQHNYQRGERNNVKYTIIGGAGGQLEDSKVQDFNLYKVTENKHHFVIIDVYLNQLFWRAFDIEGNLLDSFVIRKLKIGHEAATT